MFNEGREGAASVVLEAGEAGEARVLMCLHLLRHAAVSLFGCKVKDLIFLTVSILLGNSEEMR